MHLHTRNVNTAFQRLVGYFDGQRDALRDAPIVKKPSRNGNVMMIDEPVTVTYSHPRERVLFNEARDANPFFHLYESLWMLAGRNDVAPLAYYASKMKDFSDDGETFNGAYGYRWRHADKYCLRDPFKKDTDYFPCSVDQLNELVNHLNADPNSRRAVLQMWNVEDDLLKIGVKDTTTEANKTWKTFQPPSKDVCCNLSVMFSIRSSYDTNGADHRYDVDRGVDRPVKWLDMTVTNRSNDMIWGMLGANFVHFSFLQEYMAARLGVEVGKYNHFTNNLHVYAWNWKPEEWLKEGYDHAGTYGQVGSGNPFQHGFITVPLVKDPAMFERELPEFVKLHGEEAVRINDPREQTWQEPFLESVASPMLNAFHFHKIGERNLALESASKILADDWRLAATGWLNRRKK